MRSDGSNAASRSQGWRLFGETPKTARQRRALSSDLWTVPAPARDEKTFGKHPTQETVALIERCLSASTNEGDLLLDPFLASGTTAVACLRLNRGCVGVQLDAAYVALAVERADQQVCVALVARIPGASGGRNVFGK